jgi:hypothetical protein
MKNLSVLGAVAIILIANGLALMHGARNRSSTDSEIVLTKNELNYFNPSPADDSGVELHLSWTDTGYPVWPSQKLALPVWLDERAMQRLGFDCSVNPDSPKARRHYQEQRPRQAFVAVEYDGGAWRAWWEAHQQAITEEKAKNLTAQFPDSMTYSHLVAVDADLDPVKLRERHPDRKVVIIAPAVIAITLDPYRDTGGAPDPKHPSRVIGNIRELPSSIHVPRPFSDQFRRVIDKDTIYRVRLRYGASMEPWVVGVEFN